MRGSFARLSYLTYGDLVSIAYGLHRLAAAKPGDTKSFFDWLRTHRQSDRVVERFWTPVLVSALSETLDRVDIASARKVFVDAFLSNREGWLVQIPTVPLDELYGERLHKWLATRGAAVRLQAGVERVMIENGQATGAVLRSGEIVPADHVILAVPHWLVLELLPNDLREAPQLAKIGGLESAPISSIHLWFDRPILFPVRPENRHGNDRDSELPHAVLIGRLSQWVFNRGLLQSTAETGSSYQVVISASRNIAEWSQQETIAKVCEELAQIFPRTREAQLLHSRLVTEHRAVFSNRPGASDRRPPQQSPVANLQLAGDWTRTGWPATMEGAVRSGYLAAENVLRALGRPERVLAPDRPIAMLPRLLLRVKR